MRTIRTVAITLAAAAGLAVAVVAPVSAHVVVKPSTVPAAAFQTFTTGVPNEKDVAVTSLRLVIPAGLQHVSPNVKPGWNIDVKKEGTGEDATVKEITWSGGSIPAGQRDDFVFSAQAPAKEDDLIWKAYQTYSDGSTVSWDKAPAASGAEEEDDTSGPYSETAVTNDTSAPVTTVSEVSNAAKIALFVSVLGTAVALAALYRTFNKSQPKNR